MLPTETFRKGPKFCPGFQYVYVFHAGPKHLAHDTSDYIVGTHFNKTPPGWLVKSPNVQTADRFHPFLKRFIVGFGSSGKWP